MEARTKLDAALAAQILSSLGRADPNARMDVQPLGGGVSSTVLLVQNGTYRHVLKQPLRKFRTRDEWIVDTRRVRVDHDAAAFFQRHLRASEAA